jgi:hypothetical protein
LTSPVVPGTLGHLHDPFHTYPDAPALLTGEEDRR